MTPTRSPFNPAQIFAHDDAAKLAAALKALADPVRLRILALLAERGDMTISQLVPILRLRQPTVSHHLRILEDAGVVRARRSGRETPRSLDIDATARLAGLIDPTGGRR